MDVWKIEPGSWVLRSGGMSANTLDIVVIKVVMDNIIYDADVSRFIFIQCLAVSRHLTECLLYSVELAHVLYVRNLFPNSFRRSDFRVYVFGGSVTVDN